jgi:hypothetical protein
MNLKTKLSLLLPALTLGLALAVGPAALQAQTAPATLRITPATLEIGEGQIETLTLVLENAQGAYGIDVRGRFDPKVVEIVPAEPNAPLRAGGFIKPDFVALNAFNNVSGTFGWAATQVNPTGAVTGTGPILTIQFRGKTRGASAAIDFSSVELADRRGNVLPVTRQAGTVSVVAPKAIVAGATPTLAAVATSVLTPGPGNVPAPTVAQAATRAATAVAANTVVPVTVATAVAPPAPAATRDWTIEIIGGVALIGLIAGFVVSRRRAGK